MNRIITLYGGPTHLEKVNMARLPCRLELPALNNDSIDFHLPNYVRVHPTAYVIEGEEDLFIRLSAAKHFTNDFMVDIKDTQLLEKIVFDETYKSFEHLLGAYIDKHLAQKPLLLHEKVFYVDMLEFDRKSIRADYYFYMLERQVEMKDKAIAHMQSKVEDLHTQLKLWQSIARCAEERVADFEADYQKQLKEEFENADLDRFMLERQVEWKYKEDNTDE